VAGVATVQANNLRLIFFKGIIASHIITIISIHIAIAFVLAHTFIAIPKIFYFFKNYCICMLEVAALRNRI
jgi:hypothetical protein